MSVDKSAQPPNSSRRFYQKNNLNIKNNLFSIALKRVSSPTNLKFADKNNSPIPKSLVWNEGYFCYQFRGLLYYDLH
jgi:hypothetical protein